MKVTLAKSAGFCFGVKRAVETVYNEIEQAKMPIYTFGPIIHNEEVVSDLEEKGVMVVNSVEELNQSEKYELIHELLSPGLNTMFVTPKDIDESVKRISFTISEALNKVFLDEEVS